MSERWSVHQARLKAHVFAAMVDSAASRIRWAEQAIEIVRGPGRPPG